MKKRFKRLFSVFSILLSSSFIGVLSASAIGSTQNATNTLSNNINEKALQSSNRELSPNYKHTQWNITTDPDNPEVRRVFLDADGEIASLYPYQIIDDLTNIDLIKTFFAKDTIVKQMFISKPFNPMPTPNDFIVDETNYTINNREGWIDLNVAKKGFFNTEGEWIKDGVMQSTIVRITGLKAAKPTPSMFKTKIIDGQPIRIDMYASDFRQAMLDLYNQPDDPSSSKRFFDFISQYFEGFSWNAFPFKNKSDLNLDINNISFVNNHIGSLNLVARPNHYFANDSLCTYIDSPLQITGKVDLTLKGTSSFNSHVINYDNSFGETTPLDFKDLIVNQNVQTIKWVKDKVFGLINNPKNGTQSTTSIELSNNPADYDVSSDKGTLVLAGSINNVFVDNSQVIPSIKFGKDQQMQISITGFNRVADTKIFQNTSYPIVDLKDPNHRPLNPEEVATQLQGEIGKPWNQSDILNSFLIIMNPPTDMSNLKLKSIDTWGDIATGELFISKIVLEGAIVNGVTSELTFTPPMNEEHDDTVFVYNFPRPPKKLSTSISPIMYVDNELGSDKYAHEINFNDNALMDKYKQFIIDYLIANPPESKQGNRPIQVGDIHISQPKVINNRLGYVEVDVELGYFLQNDQINKPNTKLKQTVKIQGYNVLNSTIIDRKLDYPKNIYPSDLIDGTWGKDMTPQQKALSFFNIFNLPTTSYNPQNNKQLKDGIITKFEPKNADNKLGTIDITIEITNGFYENDPTATFKSSPISKTIKFNLLKNASPTKIKETITLNGVQNWLPSEFVDLIKQDDLQAINILKSAIYDAATDVPTEINSNNFLDWIEIKDFSNIDNANKSFTVVVSIKKWFDENGILCPNTSNQTNKEFTVNVNGNFRNFINTRFRTPAQYKVDKKWQSYYATKENFPREEIINFIVQNWKKMNMLEGDIPPEINDSTIRENLVISTTPDYNKRQGEINFVAKLKTYYDNNTLVTGDQDGYTDDTLITLYGFRTEEDTKIPNTNEQPKEVTGDFSKPSLIWTESTDTNKWDEVKWKQFILDYVITGSKQDIDASHIESFSINRIDDKRGLISFDFVLSRYWKNGSLKKKEDPTSGYNVMDATGKNVVVTGFAKEQPSIMLDSKVQIELKEKSKTATEFFEENKSNLEFWQKLVFNKSIARNLPKGFDTASNFSIDLTNKNVITNNREGVITLKVVKFNTYYDQTFGLKTTNGQFDFNVPANQENIASDQYPYPSGITNNETITIDKNSPVIEVEITGFKKITGQTEFDTRQEIPYNKNSNLVIEGHSTKKLTQELIPNRFNEEFKQYVLDNCITGQKDSITWQDIDVQFNQNPSYDIQLGTITAEVSLNKYWDQNGNLVTVKAPETSQRKKVFTFTGFTPYTNTVVNNEIHIPSTILGMSDKSPSEIQAILTSSQHKDHKRYMLSIKDAILSKCVTGNKNGSVGKIDNIIDIVPSNPDALNGTITISFKLNQVWDVTSSNFNDVPVSNAQHTYTLVIEDLRVEQPTTVIPTIDLNKFYFNSQAEEYFDVHAIKANEFLTNGYKEIAFVDVVYTLFEQNFNNIFRNINKDPNNPANDTKVKKDSISGRITPEGKLMVSVTLTNAKILNSSNSIINGDAQFEVELTGFKPTPTGATKIIINRTKPVYPHDELYSYINNTNGRKINSVDFKDLIFVEKLPDAIELLKKFIFNNWIDKNSNIDRLTFEHVEILPSPIDQTNPFDGILSVRFYLTSYYNTAGELIQNATFEQAMADKMYKDVNITNFPKINTNSNGPTVGLDKPIKISAVITGLDDNGDKILDNTLINSKASDWQQNEQLLKAWIMQNMYTGNLDYLKNEDLSDANNVNLSVNDVDDNEGYMMVTVSLKNYWTSDGQIANDGCTILNVKIFGFQKIKKTKASDQVFDLIDKSMTYVDENGVEGQPDIDSWALLVGYKEIYDKINESKVNQFYNEIRTDTVTRDKVKKFLKTWVIHNKQYVFYNLPEGIDLEKDLDVHVDSESGEIKCTPRKESGELIVEFVLRKYHADNGALVTNSPKSFTVTFSGFLLKGVPTKIRDQNFSVWVTRNGNSPFYSASTQDNQPLSSIFPSEMMDGDELANHYKWLVARMILNEPENNEFVENYLTDKNGEYTGLIDGNMRNGVGKQKNIIITSAKPLDTLGEMIIQYKLEKAWSVTDDLKPTLKDLGGTIRIKGFKVLNPIAQASEKMLPFILGGTGVGVSIIFIIIVVVVVYKKRKDIEYQQ